MDEELKKQLTAMLDDFKKGLPVGISADEMKSALEKFKEENAPKVTKEDFDKLTKAMKEQGALLTDMNKNGMGSKATFESILSKAIADKHTEIMGFLAKGTGLVEIDVTKAVGNITTESGTNTNPPALTGVQQAPLGNINLRSLNVEQYMTVLPTDQGAAYPYTEAVPKDGDYTFVAEGTAKPQIDFQWDTKYATPKKIAAWMKLTEESIKDVRGLEGVAYNFLRRKHDLKKSKALLFADGTGINPKGATKYGRAFVAGAMASKLVNPNFMDVVNACIVDIATTHNYEDETPYMANLVYINSVDFFINVISAKTEQGVPLYPTASLFNMVTIGATTIIPEESIPSGKIFVADLTKYNITDYVPYMIKIGWVNDDFIKNQFVILAESRFHQFVKKLDEQAFIYDDIATIKSAITYSAPVTP